MQGATKYQPQHRTAENRVLHSVPSRNPKLQPALPSRLCFGPSRLGSRRDCSSPGSTHLPLGFPCRFSGWCGPFDPRPSCLLSPSHLGPGGCTELPLFLGSFSRLSRSGCRTVQELIQFTLQDINSLFQVGCFTQLCWCNVDHNGRSLEGYGVLVKHPRLLAG